MNQRTYTNLKKEAEFPKAFVRKNLKDQVIGLGDINAAKPAFTISEMDCRGEVLFYLFCQLLQNDVLAS